MAASSLSRSVFTFTAILYLFSKSRISFDQSSSLCTKPLLAAETFFYLLDLHALQVCHNI